MSDDGALSAESEPSATKGHRGRANADEALAVLLAAGRTAREAAALAGGIPSSIDP